VLGQAPPATGENAKPPLPPESSDTFSISRFKTVRIRVKDKALNSGAESASVFVVAASGELLLKKHYPLSGVSRQSS